MPVLLTMTFADLRNARYLKHCCVGSVLQSKHWQHYRQLVCIYHELAIGTLPALATARTAVRRPAKCRLEIGGYAYSFVRSLSFDIRSNNKYY